MNGATVAIIGGGFCGTLAAIRLLAGDGTPSEVLYYVGPLLRARHREATAVPELRGHVDRTTAAITVSRATGAGSYIRKLAAPVFRREQTIF